MTHYFKLCLAFYIDPILGLAIKSADYYILSFYAALKQTEHIFLTKLTEPSYRNANFP